MANEAVHTLSVYSGQFLIASVLTVKNNKQRTYLFCLYVILIKYTFKIQSIVKGSFPLIFFEVGFPSLVCADDSYSFTFEKDFLLVVGFERGGAA